MSNLDTIEVEIQMDYSAFITALVVMTDGIEILKKNLETDPNPSDGYWAGRIAEAERAIASMKACKHIREN